MSMVLTPCISPGKPYIALEKEEHEWEEEEHFNEHFPLFYGLERYLVRERDPIRYWENTVDKYS